MPNPIIAAKKLYPNIIAGGVAGATNIAIKLITENNTPNPAIIAPTTIKIQPILEQRFILYP